MVRCRCFVIRFAIAGTLCLAGTGVAKAEPLALGDAIDRPDRLILLSGERTEDLLAECRAKDDEPWQPATFYLGTNPDDWRTLDRKEPNEIFEGRLPAGSEPCLWNYYFDLEMPADAVQFRLRSTATEAVVLERSLDVRSVRNVFLIDHRNFSSLAQKPIASPWRLEPGPRQQPPRPNLGLPFTRELAKPDDRYPIYRYVEAGTEPIVLSPKLSGWYRLYVGTEVQTSFQLSLSKENLKYPVPEYMGGKGYSRPMQDYLVTCADMTGQDVRIEAGGARYWRDVSIRYLRFVPMTGQEVRLRQETLRFAHEHGRPFAAYVESVTPCHYQPRTLRLRDHVRNQMGLHKKRGCTDVYVHVIRLGSQAWYHSDVAERYLPSAPGNPDHPDAKWLAWMEQGDPLAVAVEEARSIGLRVMPDMGMNVSYKDRRDKLIRDHPEYLVGGKGIFLDYRRPEVRDYAVLVATELLTKCDVDGINLDFARFAANTAFDTKSLVDVVGRIHHVRRQAEIKWGHPLVIAARIPSYRYHERLAATYTGDYPEFLDALKIWAREGWVDRVQACGMGSVHHLGTISIERYARAIEGTGAVLWGDLYGGGAFPNTAATEWLDVARNWTRQGLDGGFFFYATDRPIEFSDLDWQLRLIDFPERAAVLRR